MPRLFYLLYRLATDLISLISRFLNAFIFGGSTSQTLSARSYLEGHHCPRWRLIGKIINWIFFWQENHIEWAWQEEVTRAEYTLKRLEGLN
jgi:hypothetical protein